jgi:RNA 3'-terminal phosphate cyclase (ATP)
MSLHQDVTSVKIRYFQSIVSYKMHLIDGSIGEGGGQIIRNAITYAALLKQPIKVHSVRAGRSKPGLRAQHVCGLQLAADICGGSLVGAEVGSTTFEFHPSSSRDTKDENKNPRTNICMDIGTAGSVCLLMQVGLPCWIFNPIVQFMELRGGTNAELAPQIDYLEEVLIPILSRYVPSQNYVEGQRSGNASAMLMDINVETRGYYPIGKGLVKCSLHPRLERFAGPIDPIVLMDRGKVISVHIKCFYAGKAPQFLASKMGRSASDFLRQNSCKEGLPELEKIKPSIEIVKHEPAVGTATGIIIIAKTSADCIFGASALGNRKERVEMTGIKAAQELISNLQSGGCVDEWLQDQIIIFMALANGESRIRTGSLTQHTRTAVDVARIMTGAVFTITKVDYPGEDQTVRNNDGEGHSTAYGKEGLDHGQHIITCRGIGFKRTRIKDTKGIRRL